MNENLPYEGRRSVPHDVYRCPRCESRAPFHITATATFVVDGNGTHEHFAEEWNDSNTMECVVCGCVRTLKEFER